MKDTLVKLGYYAYMLRVDILNDFNEAVEWFHDWKQKYDCVYYIVGQEISNDGKPHLQSIVWFENEISLKDKPKLRNWWNDRSANTKQSVAFTSAKKIKSLAKYSKKDENFITNLHDEEIKKIGNWENAQQRRALWTEKLEKYAASVAIELKNKEDDYDVQEVQTNYATYKYKYPIEQIREEFLVKILQFYRQNKKRPSRSTLHYLVWKNELSSTPDLDLLQTWGLIKLF